jgi:integrase
MAKVRKRTWTTKTGPKTAWLVDYRDQAGKRRFMTYDRKKDADAALIDAQGEIKQGIHTPSRASATIAEAAEIWMRACGETPEGAKPHPDPLERSTLKQYRNHVDRHIVPLIGTAKLSKLSTPAIEQFCEELSKKCSRPMARKVLTSLKSIIRAAQRKGLIAHNPAAPVKVDMKKRDQRKLAVGRDIPSKEEVQAILARAEGRWRPVFVTAIFTGMRASELRGLTWKDVDFDARVVHVRQRANLWGEIGSPKSLAGQREIPMSPMVANALKEWRLSCPRLKPTDGEGEGRLWLVFPSSTGLVESHTSIMRGFQATQVIAGAVSADGKPKYGLHALRHFFASWAIERGFSPKRLQELLGHSSIRMTFDVYGHLFPSLEDDHAKFAAGEQSLLSSAAS